MRVAIIGGDQDFQPTELERQEINDLVDFFIKTGRVEISTGGGGGAPLAFAEAFFAKGGKVFVASPFENEVEARKQGEKWIPPEGFFVRYCGHKRHWSERDPYTLESCEEIWLLPWVDAGLGSIRELALAGKFMGISSLILFNSSSRVHRLLKNDRQDDYHLIVSLFQNKLKGNKSIRILGITELERAGLPK